MLIWLTEYLTQFDSGFGVFKYLTLRTILSVLTSLFISFILGHYLINHLTSIENLRQGIGLQSYGQKDPLMAFKKESLTSVSYKHLTLPTPPYV